MIRCTIGTTRWFFCPRTLSPSQQESALALSYYLTAPLGVSILALLSLPLLWVDHPAARTLCTIATSILPLASIVWYYVVLVIGLRRIARREGRNLAFSAVTLAAVWLATWAGIVVAPLCIVMWALMYGSLT